VDRTDHRHSGKSGRALQKSPARQSLAIHHAISFAAMRTTLPGAGAARPVPILGEGKLIRAGFLRSSFTHGRKRCQGSFLD
jgi:hypothetical protein